MKLKIKKSNNSSKKALVPDAANDDSILVTANKSSTYWRGQFDGDIQPLVKDLLKTIRDDRRLATIAIDSIIARVKILSRRKVIEESVSSKLSNALAVIKKDFAENVVKVDSNVRSIYSYIEERITSIVGNDAEYIKIGVGPEDQFAGDCRILVRDMYDQIEKDLCVLRDTVAQKAESYVGIFSPSNIYKYSLPSSMGHTLMSMFGKFARDSQRMSASRKRSNRSPYGAAGGTGTTFDVNRDTYAKALEFEGLIVNSLDAVTSWDFVLEFLTNLGICANHLTSLIQDLIVWQSPYLRFINISSHFTPPHPILDQNRDPYMLEVLRGKCSKIIGNVSNGFVILHNLPNAATPDSQSLLNLIFDTYDTLHLCINSVSALLANIIVNRKTIKEAAQKHYSTIPDLIDWIVINLGVSFSEAKEYTKQIVDLAISKNKKLSLLSMEELQSILPQVDSSIYKVLIFSRSVINRKSVGGPNNVQLRKTIRNTKGG